MAYASGMEATTVAAHDTEAAAFVERFTETWANPSLDGFQALVHPDGVLEQPIQPRMVGKAAHREGFRRLLEDFPGIHGEVHGWSGTAGELYIWMTLRVPGGSRPIEWDLVDKIILEDGLVLERISYFDGLSLIGQVLRRPSLWPKLIKSRLQIG